MGYRNPGGFLRSVNIDRSKYKDITEKERLRVETLQKEYDANQKALYDTKVQFANERAINGAKLTGAMQEANVNNASLLNSVNGGLDELYAARTRMQQATGNYEKYDKDGNLLYSYDEDVKINNKWTNYFNNFDKTLSNLQYMNEEYSKLQVGKAEGDIDAGSTNPMWQVMMNNQADISYNIVQDPVTGQMKTDIVLSGDMVKKVNQERYGNSEDSYTFTADDLASVNNNADGNPSYYGAYTTRPTIIRETIKNSEERGFIKNGQWSDNFQISGATEEKYDEFAQEKYKVKTTSVNVPAVWQSISGGVEAKTDVQLGYGVEAAHRLVDTYAKYDKQTGEYYIEDYQTDGNGQVLYDDNGNPIKGERINLGNGWYDLNSNEMFGETKGFSEEDYNNMQKLMKIKSLEDIGAYRQQKIVPIGEKYKLQPGDPGYRSTEKTTKPTEGQVKRENAIELTAKGVNALSKLSSNDLRDINKVQAALSPITNLFGGEIDVTDGKIVLTNFYTQDSKGNVSIKDRSQPIDISNLTGLEAQKRVMQELLNISYDVNVLDYSQQQIDKLVGGYKFDPSTVSTEIDDLMGELVNEAGELKDEEDIVEIIKNKYPDIDISESIPFINAVTIDSTTLSNANYTPQKLREAIESQIYGQTQEVKPQMTAGELIKKYSTEQ